MTPPKLQELTIAESGCTRPFTFYRDVSGRPEGYRTTKQTNKQTMPREHAPEAPTQGTAPMDIVEVSLVNDMDSDMDSDMDGQAKK